MIEDITSIAKEIVQYFTSKNGEPITKAVIANRFKVGLASMSYILNEMTAQGQIRAAKGIRHAQYYVPTTAQLAAEASYNTPKPRSTLRIDPHRSELYERLRKERDAYPSVFGEAA